VRSAFGKKATPNADYFLTTLFPSNQLYIMDYNRLLKDMNGLSVDDFLKTLEEKFTIEKKDKAYRPEALHQFGLYMNNQWYKLTSKPGTYTEDPIGI